VDDTTATNKPAKAETERWDDEEKGRGTQASPDGMAANLLFAAQADRCDRLRWQRGKRVLELFQLQRVSAQVNERECERVCPPNL
jgi:hypothetical protein